MPKQPPAAGLVTGWWRDEFNEALAHGDPVETIHDYSGLQGDLEQPVGANQPAYETKIRWGRPAYRFGQAAAVHWMEGPDSSDLLNPGTGTVFVSFYLTTFASEQTLITDSTGPSHGNWGLRVMTTGELRATNNNTGVNIGVAAGGDLFELTLNAWHIGIWEHSGGDLYVYLDDPLFFQKVASGNTAGFLNVKIGASSSGANPMADGYIGEILTYDAGLNDTNRSQVFGYMANGWLDRGDPLARKRDAGSRRLDKFERPRGRHTIHVPESFLASAELYEPHAISHPYLPTATGEGAGQRRWERGVVVPVARRWDLDRNLLELTIADRRGLSHLYRESGVATRSADPRREGVKISGVGPYRFPVSGTTKAWVHSATVSTGPGPVVEVPAGVEAAEVGGIVTEPASINFVIPSSFIDGLDDLSVNGTGVNGSDIIADPTDDIEQPGLFHPDVTGFCARFTAGTPHAADLYLEATTTPIELIQANSRLCFSMDTAQLTGPAGDPLAWQLQNDVDSLWWDDVNETWSASPVWNLGVTVYGRTASNPIMWPSSNGHALWRVGLPTGGTSGRLSRLFHVQLEPVPFPTGRIVHDNVFFGTRTDRFLSFQEWTS